MNMTCMITLFNEEGKAYSKALNQGSCGCPIIPRLGEALEHKGIRYIVVDITWDLSLERLNVSAIRQESENELHPAVQEGAGRESVRETTEASPRLSPKEKERTSFGPAEYASDEWVIG